MAQINLNPSMMEFDEDYIEEKKEIIEKTIYLNELKQKISEMKEKILITRSELNPFFKRSYTQNVDLMSHYEKISTDIKILRSNIISKFCNIKNKW